MTRNIDHEVNRQVTENEKLLWQRVKEWLARNEGAVEPPAVKLADYQTPMNAERAKQIIRTWDNEGLVSIDDGTTNYCMVTEYGRQVDQIVEDRITGESWR